MVALLVACASTPPTADAEVPGAKQTELDLAFELYQAEQYNQAADAFKRAYEQSGDSSALAGQASSLQRAGDCHEAAIVYERFLELELDPTYNNAIRTIIERCQ
jgi:tetratricopeptide (TPR) repeat protein